MRHKLNTFILKNPPEEKVSKAEKRCAPHPGLGKTRRRTGQRLLHCCDRRRTEKLALFAVSPRVSTLSMPSRDGNGVEDEIAYLKISARAGHNTMVPIRFR